jgi:3D (Asp-Asp-Asp) domain-containing protein
VRWERISAFGASIAGVCCLAVATSIQPADAQGFKHVNAYLANDVIALQSSASTVGGFLDELSLRLPPDAPVDPSPDAALYDGMSVQMPKTSVTRGEDTRVIPAETKITEAWHYGPSGMEQTDAGQDGLERTSYTIYYYNNHEAGRRERTQVVRRMQPRQMVSWHQLTSDDGPSLQEIIEARVKPGTYVDPPRRWRELRTMEATAYEPGPGSCGPGASGNTSCGYRAGYGVVAVDPSVIPYHTRLYIEGYGFAVAGDTGSAIKGDRIDLGFMTEDECFAWGRKDVKVYVLY